MKHFGAMKPPPYPLLHRLRDWVQSKFDVPPMPSGSYTYGADNPPRRGAGWKFWRWAD